MKEWNVTNQIVLFVVAFVASVSGVGFFIKWSLSRGLIDIPNERSSHSTPTPRGGGLIIVLACLTGYLVGGLYLGLSFSWGYCLGAVLVAAVSWLDDLYSLPFWSRLIVHITAAFLLIWDTGVWLRLQLPLFSTDLDLGTTFGALLTVAWVVWLLNAYNFMDGIDGIAAAQAIVTGIAWAGFAWAFEFPSIFYLAGIIASTTAGFLIYNWQPARVFMGDVGSAFLGFTLAAMPLLAQRESHSNAAILPVVGVLFVWLFVFDTVFTMIRRAMAGERVWEAHRSHIYQKLVIEGHRHSTVTLVYGLAAAILALFVLIALVFSGIYEWFAFLFLLALTFSLAYQGLRKKR